MLTSHRYPFDCWSMQLHYVGSLLLYAKSAEQCRSIGPSLQLYHPILAGQATDAMATLHSRVWPAIDGKSHARLAVYVELASALLQVWSLIAPVL